MSREDETIAAIATATGGGVGVVRMSGPGAIEIARRVVRPWPDVVPSHRMWRAEAAGDTILCVVMLGPRSYTGEDVVELQGHGGQLSLRRLLAALLDAGARMAGPGEFTRRAFEHGKMDLAAAEAVAGIIAARTERALAAAQASAHGGVAKVIAEVRALLIGVLAELEARIDFPEDELTFQGMEEIERTCADVKGRLQRLGATFRQGKLLSDGLTVALVGSPNVGKSSLLNALLGEERALVTEIAGTTRDYLESTVDWRGVPVTLVDTAGEREASEGLERRGLELGRRRAAAADVVVAVIDVEQPRVPSLRAEVIACNKIDLDGLERPTIDANGRPLVWVSARTGAGLDALREAVLGAAGVGSEGASETLLQTERQYSIIRTTEHKLVDFNRNVRDCRPPEVMALELREALQELDRMTGESIDEAVLDAIFSRFCIGK